MRPILPAWTVPNAELHDRLGAAIDRDRLSRPIQSIFDGGLHEFITDFLRANAALARQIERDYRFVE